ncbi:MAG: nucleotidyltransferase domain-containing protein [Planctomycetes bacterium]|jgi:predicted nucleotidyltransferase|nr:nucleotidyltransferase domain-containing protein [Planctomycetota bacterium]
MVYVSEELIERMAQKVVAEVNPEKIVLFGSWARGEANEQSDVDFLVVERDPFGPNRSRREEAVRIWKCLYEFRVPKDILVYSVSEIDRWKDSRYHVVGRALKEGKVLYESDRCAP